MDWQKIVIHHSASPATVRQGGLDIPVNAAMIREWHLIKGWSDIGYHFVILPDGSCEPGRPIYRPGAHCIASNRNFIGLGICLVGNFSEIEVPDVQLAGLVNKVEALMDAFLEQSGRIHQLVMEEYVPKMLRENISEAELAGEIYSALLKEGHDGVLRVGTFDSQIEIGLVSFGESSLYPTYFAGPGGNYGISTAMPFIGSRERKLKKGDLVHIDVGCSVGGYNSDKTMTYMFGESLPQKAISDHHKCVEIQNQIAEMLKPGAIPAQIYNSVINKLSPDFLENFMGFGNKRAKFLGHGIGLSVDEWPVIAEGFSEPLEEGMAFAIEPKKGIANIGMVGIENTFLVTPKGGKCITGNNAGLIPVY